MRSLIIGLVGTVVLTVAPAVASAETISESAGTITIQSAAGEASNLVQSVVVAGQYRFADTGTDLDGTTVSVTAGAGCTTITATSVDCPSATATKVVANLLDQSDILNLGALPATVAVTADGGEGRDLIVSGAGNDTLKGSPGDDTLQGGAGNDVIDGGTGDDVVNAGQGTDTVTGGSGDDSLAGGPGNDTLSGGDGEDTLLADAGNDVLNGGDGDGDVYDASSDSDSQTISLDGVANDTSASGTDNVMPDVENVRTGDGDDTVTGSAENNDIATGDGNDVVDPGPGNDVVNLGAGNDTGQGSPGNDVMSGGDGNDSLDGATGDDTLDGGAGTDQLAGDAGNDTLEPDTGSDTLLGGAGTDTVSYQGVAQGGISVSLDGAANDGQPGENQNVATDVENVVGSAGNDVIVGGAGFNLLSGGAGDDVITSRDKVADLVECGLGYDTVTADGFDVIDQNVSHCESINLGSLSGFGPSVAIVLSSKATKRVALTATCLPSAIGFCQATVALTAAGRPAGSTTFVLLPGQTTARSITLSLPAAKRLRKLRALKVVARTTSRDNRGATRAMTQTKTLHR